MVCSSHYRILPKEAGVEMKERNKENTTQQP